MKKNLLLLTVLFFYLTTSYSQTKFEKGYFINNDNERVECFIKNMDLLNTPKYFIYKLSENDSIQNSQIEEIKSFEIYNVVKYEKHLVNIDRSSELEGEISVNRKVVFKEEQLLLKVLVEGQATLYQYSEVNLNRYFYKTKSSGVEQLVFKSYLNVSDNTVRKNERYKQQLVNNLNCEGLNNGKFNNLKYQKDKLVKLFVSYNQCVNAKYTNYELKESKKSKNKINLNIRAGLDLSSFSVRNSSPILRGNNLFEDKLSFRVGIEAEFIMGFNNNKWAFLVEPNYVYYESDFTDSKERLNGIDFSARVDYKSIDLSLGIRHYFYLGDKSKLFLNASAVPNFTLQSEIASTKGAIGPDALNYEGKADLNFGFGFGYKYQDKLSFEFRYFTTRDLISNFVTVGSELNSLSLIVGYTLF